MFGQTFDVASQSFGHRVQFGCGYIAQVALLQFAFDLGELEVELTNPMLGVSQKTFMKVVEDDRALVLDFEAEFPAPEDERALGDAEILGKLLEAVPLSATRDEFLFCFRCMHIATDRSTGFGGRARLVGRLTANWRNLTSPGVKWRRVAKRKNAQKDLTRLEKGGKAKEWSAGEFIKNNWNCTERAIRCG
jgi:hypothetical protein